MKAWLGSLETRDRRMLLIGLAALVLGGGYLFAYEPFVQAHENLAVRLEAQRTLNDYLKETAAEVKRLQASGPARTGRHASQSVLSVIDQTSRTAGIKKEMKRLTPVSDKKVRLWFEGVPFDRFSGWLTGLSRDSGLVIEDINISPEDEAGLVRVNLTLARPAG